MKTQGQHETSALQLQKRVAELEQENAQMRRENKRLPTSEARYRGCFENSPLSMVFISVDGRPMQANRAFERMYGRTLRQPFSLTVTDTMAFVTRLLVAIASSE